MRPGLAVLFLSAALCGSYAQETAAQRVVLIKVDGLPHALVERYASEGKLPWIKRTFLDHGTEVQNFYVRGISLSAPSWSMLDSGGHLAIKGNAEFDRSYPRVYDYLNFFPFYLQFARLRRADMPAVEALDGAGVPLLIDHFRPEDRYQSMQLFQRGIRWETLRDTLVTRFARPIGQLLSEWQSGGLEFSAGISSQQERELLAALANPRVKYLDLFVGDYDHTAHLTNDERSQIEVLRKLDALVGRLSTAVEGSPLARQTVLVLVSDHGMNSTPEVYSQGYSLVRFLNSQEGGAHHVITTRHPLTEYKLRGLDPLVSWVTTPSGESTYLKGREDYPTALLDPDGNERASLQLRNSDWNALQILFERKDGTVLKFLDKHREEWTRDVPVLREELQALRRAISKLREQVARDPKRWKREEWVYGRPLEALRRISALETWQRDEQGYSTYLATTEGFLKWKPGDPPVEIPKGTMGGPNTLDNLRNYVTGTGPNGLERMDYLRALTGVEVRNVVQKGLGRSPVDFVAVRSGPSEVLLYRSEDQQALLSWKEENGTLHLHYAPVQGTWRPGLPLDLSEDPQLCVEGDRAEWLNGWHTEKEWFAATYRTRYSNGVIGLAEHFRPWAPSAVPALFKVADERDWPLLERFAGRRRRNVEADLLIFAADHWNFNVKGFNPGGNHGSLLQTSTRSVLMLAGAGVPQGLKIAEPHDSLSFVPTVLGILGKLKEGEYPGQPISELVRR